MHVHIHVITFCACCGRRQWYSVHSVGNYKVLLWLDDEEDSDTYGEQLRRCPTCGTNLPILDRQSTAISADFTSAAQSASR